MKKDWLSQYKWFIVLALIGVFSYVVIANNASKKRDGNEKYTVALLMRLYLHQNQFQSMVIKDANDNDKGEFASNWKELAGEIETDEEEEASAGRMAFFVNQFEAFNLEIDPRNPKLAHLKDPRKKKDATEEKDNPEKEGNPEEKDAPKPKEYKVASGYYLKLFSSHDIEGFEDGDDEIDDEKWACVAWPMAASKTGTRCFVVTQDGMLYVYDNTDAKFNGIGKQIKFDDIFIRPFETRTIPEAPGKFVKYEQE